MYKLHKKATANPTHGNVSKLNKRYNVDIIIKLIDISSSDIDGHIATIEDTLNYLECNNNKSILVFNKIDKVTDKIKFNKIKRRLGEVEARESEHRREQEERQREGRAHAQRLPY